MTKSNLFHNSDIVYQVYFAGKKKDSMTTFFRYQQNSLSQYLSILFLFHSRTFNCSDQGTLLF